MRAVAVPMLSPAVLAVLLMCLTTTAVVPGLALRVQPTIASLTFDVGNDEVCMYSMGKDFYEGVTMHYHVMEGGEDFDVFIRDVDGHVIYASYAGEHGAEDRVYFTTHAHKEYAYCIDNRDYTGKRKLIKMEVGLTSLKRWKTRIDPLRKLMTRTDSFVMGMHDDQMLLRLKESDMREWVENVFTMLKVRAVTETVVVVAITLLNAFFIAYLFRRAVR